MKRRALTGAGSMAAGVAALLALGQAEGEAAGGRPSPPNVLFIAVDDLRPELGCYGNEHIQSPNIDRLARMGMVFNRAYCQQAVCSPSRTSLMTGARPDTTGVWDLTTHFRQNIPEVVTLGQHFKGHGYFVRGLGKIYHGELDDAPTWSVPWESPRAPVYALPENRALNELRGADGVRLAGPSSRGPAFESADVPDETFFDGQVTGKAVEALRGFAGSKQPFFLAVGLIRPHLPFVAPKKYWDLYDPARIPAAPNPFPPKGAPGYAMSYSGGELWSYHGIPAGPIQPALARQLKHGYYAATSYMDAQVGRMLDELERQGLAENTIVVLWGDHGWKLGEHGAWCKHSNVENDTRSPLILSAPGMKRAGGRTDALVEFVDVYPTLCELAGLPLPGHLEGTSMRPLLEDPGRAWKPAVFSQYPRVKTEVMGISMRTDRYRLTVWVDLKDRSIVRATELYDHQADPQENTNIAAEPANAALVATLMEQWKKGWKAALPPSG